MIFWTRENKEEKTERKRKKYKEKHSKMVAKSRNEPTMSAVANDNPSLNPGLWQSGGKDVPISTVMRRNSLEAYLADISSPFRIQMETMEIQRRIDEIVNKNNN